MLCTSMLVVAWFHASNGFDGPVCVEPASSSGRSGNVRLAPLAGPLGLPFAIMSANVWGGPVAEGRLGV